MSKALKELFELLILYLSGGKCSGKEAAFSIVDSIAFATIVAFFSKSRRMKSIAFSKNNEAESLHIIFLVAAAI